MDSHDIAQFSLSVHLYLSALFNNFEDNLTGPGELFNGTQLPVHVMSLLQLELLPKSSFTSGLILTSRRRVDDATSRVDEDTKIQTLWSVMFTVYWL